MKKYLFALTTICLSAFASPVDWTKEVQVVNIIHLNDTNLQEIAEGKHPDLAVEFSAHTKLPINFYLKGDLIHLADEPWGTVEIQQTFYGRCVGEELFLSSNLTDWKPLLEFLTGAASISLNIQEGKPSIVIGTEANLRSKIS